MFLPLLIKNDIKLGFLARKTCTRILFFIKHYPESPSQFYDLNTAQKICNPIYDFANPSNPEYFIDNNRFKNFMIKGIHDSYEDVEKPVKIYRNIELTPDKPSEIYKLLKNTITQDFLESYLKLYAENSGPILNDIILLWHRFSQATSGSIFIDIAEKLVDIIKNTEKLGYTRLGVAILTAIISGGKNWGSVEYQKVVKLFFNLVVDLSQKRHNEFSVDLVKMVIMNRGPHRLKYFYEQILKNLNYVDETYLEQNLMFLILGRGECFYSRNFDSFIWNEIIVKNRLYTKSNAKISARLFELVKMMTLSGTVANVEVDIHTVCEVLRDAVGDISNFNPTSRDRETDEQKEKDAAFKHLVYLLTCSVRNDNFNFDINCELVMPFAIKCINLRGNYPNAEIEISCKKFLRQVASNITKEHKVQEKIISSIESNSFHNPEVVLNLLPVFSWANMFLLSEKSRKSIKKLAIQYIENSNQFIRRGAANLLASLFQLNLISKKEIDTIVNKKVQNVHSKVAIFTGIILTEPYDIPSWLPALFPVLVQLLHTLKSPEIRTDLNNCMKEFKRTHLNGWETLHKPKFTESQLEAFYELQEAPSYIV